jgi:uncharacterized 2Fe-2S/4Fe-4S cluster protein (DUF4445 family)
MPLACQECELLKIIAFPKCQATESIGDSSETGAPIILLSSGVEATATESRSRQMNLQLATVCLEKKLKGHSMLDVPFMKKNDAFKRHT